MDMSVLIYAPDRSENPQGDGSGWGQQSGVLRRRMKHQMDEEEKKQLADRVIYNDEKSMLLPQIIDIARGY